MSRNSFVRRSLLSDMLDIMVIRGVLAVLLVLLLAMQERHLSADGLVLVPVLRSLDHPRLVTMIGQRGGVVAPEVISMRHFRGL
ncbi:hypothetical protein Ac2012v2_006503 [Leucoagaricus gongylophorus]